MKTKNTVYLRKQAAIVALVMLLTVFSNYLTVLVRADTLATFTVNLPTGIGGAVQVVLIDKSALSPNLETTATAGVAIFENEVDDTKEYSLQVFGMIGYEEYNRESVSLETGAITVTTDELTPLPVYTVSGNVVDEEGAPYLLAGEVSYDGYQAGSEAISEGSFSFEIYGTKDYTMTIRVADEKYADINLGTVNLSANHDFGAQELVIRSFIISTNEVVNGSITPENASVAYGDDLEISIAADPGYRIASLNVDGFADEDAEGLIEYQQSFTDVREIHSVSATFEEEPEGDTVYDTFTVTVPDGSIGDIQVTLTEGSESRTLNVVDGSAAFINVIDSEKTYTMEITGMIGYDGIMWENLSFDHEAYEISGESLEEFELGTCTITGKLRDENNNWFNLNIPLYVSLSGYEEKEIELDINTYEFDVYAGVEYTLTFSAVPADPDADKYAPHVLEDQTFWSNTVLGRIQLQLNQFTITTDAGVGGSILFPTPIPDETSRTYDYGSNVTLNIQADDHYVISGVTDQVGEDDPVEISGIPEGSNSYSYPINIKDHHTIAATFEPVAYSVTVTCDGDGSVEWENGITPNQDGTIFVNYNSTPEFEAIAGQNRRVSRIVLGDDTVYTSEPGALPDRYTYQLPAVTDNQELEVFFEIDEHQVVVIEQKYALTGDYEGDITTTTMVNYNEIYEISAPPKDGYHVYEARLGSVPLSLDNNYHASVTVEGDITIYLEYHATEPLAPEPSDYYSMRFLVGEDEVQSIYTHSNDGIFTYVLPRDSSVEFTPKPDYIIISVGGSFDTRVNIDSSREFREIYVRDNTDWSLPWKNTNIIPFRIIIDNQAPAFYNGDGAIQASPATWTNGEVTISGKVGDQLPSSGLSRVVWSTTVMNEEEVLEESVNRQPIGSGGSYEFNVTGEQSQIYYVYAIDRAGNVSDYDTVQVRIDQTAPIISDFAVRGTEDSQSLQVLPFGTFSNRQVILTVTASDPDVSSSAESSGLRSITLLINGVQFEAPALVDDNGSAEFTVPADLFDDNSLLDLTVSAVATDSVGNTTTTAVSADISGDAFAVNKLMLENIAPTAEIVPIVSGEGPFEDASGNLWYSEDPTIEVNVGDINSGIRSISIIVNGQNIEEDRNGKAINAIYTEEMHEDNFTLVVDPELRRPDGSYVIRVWVEDNAGNTYTTDTAVYQDIDLPVISGFRFASADEDEGSEAAGVDVEVTDYGYFFPEDTIVTIYAEDTDPSAGVRSITYYTNDVQSGSSTDVTVNTIDEAISFTIPAHFKGKIYAKATDNVGNTPSDFTTPLGTIIESPENHLEETHITFEKPSTAMRDRNGSELYADDVNVLLTVTDTYSGLYKVEWSVVAPHDTGNNQRGELEINDDKSYVSDDDADGWSQTQTDENLVTEMARTIRVTNNSNDIRVWVRITDRAGNVSEESITFSIDQTKPTIQVTYDNNAPDRQYSDYYNSDRTATIVITERNFSPEDVEVAITNAGGGIPALSAWTMTENSSNPDQTKYTATIRYATDGDYTFDIGFTDLAGNRADSHPRHSFTIDKTNPVVSVSFDNNAALNSNYYNAWRTATITVIERNFDAGRIRVNGTAADDGTVVSFPATSGWTSHGDRHTATIQFAKDATFRFDISGQDRAGNNSAEYRQGEFVVDTTAPTISITGVEDRSANNGAVIPIVSYSDTNFDAEGLTLLLDGSNIGSVTPSGGSEEQPNGQVFTFIDFDYRKEVDDIYTLNVTLVDLAGNTSNEEIVFSVNRFGSVYAFDESLKAIQGKYIQEEIDVILTETNVDTLLHDTVKLKITVNGIPADLSEGTDYSVEFAGGDGEWSQYTYKIRKDLFSGDGLYAVMLYSVDRAGNINENINEVKEAEISFGVDKTLPVIVSVDLENDKQYPVEVMNASFSIKDNLELAGVSVYLNGEKIDPVSDGENITFTIPTSNMKQSIKVIALDAAGNEQVLEIKDFLVTTNLFYRWYNNTALFVGSLIGVGVLAAGITMFFIFFRRRKVARR